MSRQNVSRETKNRADKVMNINDKGFWELLKQAFGIDPKEVNGQFTLATQHYYYELLNIIKGRFEITCPDWWDRDFMLDLLITEGRFFISDSSIGVCPFNGNAHGINVFLRPSAVTIVNSILGTWNKMLTGLKMRKEQAAVVYLYDSRGYRSMESLIQYYAEKLASIDCSIDVNLMNSRVAFIFNVEDTQTEKEAKKVYSNISKGHPAVFTKVKDPLNPDSGGLDVQAFPAKDIFIVDKLLEAKQSIIGELLTRVGINSTPFEKKERLLVDEVNSNNEEINAHIAYPQDNLARCSKHVRDLFNIDFDIKIKEVKPNVQTIEKNTDKADNI